MTSGQHNDSAFVFPDRVFGPVKEHRRNLGVWGDMPATTASTRRASFGSYSSPVPPPSYIMAPTAKYYTHTPAHDLYDDLSSTHSEYAYKPTRSTTSTTTRYPSPSSLGYQRSFMNAYFKPASAHDDNIYRSTPPPPALVDDRVRISTPTSSGYHDYNDSPVGGTGMGMRYPQRSTPPSPMPYACYAPGGASTSSSGYSTPTAEFEGVGGEQMRANSWPMQQREQPLMMSGKSQAMQPKMQSMYPTNLPTTMEGMPVLPPHIVHEDNGVSNAQPLLAILAPAQMSTPPAIVPAVAPVVNTPTVAVSVSDPVLVQTPVPEMAFIPPPPPGAAAMEMPGVRTVLDIQQPREATPPAIVREMGPALPPIITEGLIAPTPPSPVASASRASGGNSATSSRASTPSPSPKNQIARVQVPVATPVMRDMLIYPGEYTRSTPSPTPSCANAMMAQVPVATPPMRMRGPMGPSPPPPPPHANAVPIDPAAEAIGDDESKKKRGSGIHRFGEKLHRHH